MKYDHYGMILVPVVVYPISSAFKEINVSKIKYKNMIYIIACILFICIGHDAYSEFELDVIKAVKMINDDNIASNVKEICNIINAYDIDENDPISVYGNWDIIYVISKRPHATTYSYQFPIGEVMPSIIDEYMSQLEDEQPRAIVVDSAHNDDNISKFLDEHDYKLVWEEGGSLSQEESEGRGAKLFIKQ